MGPVVKYLLDSVILIDHFNGIQAATQFIGDHASESALSVITRAEVLVGFDADTAPLALSLLDLISTLPFTRDEVDLTARLRRSHRWRLPDAIQAAIAYHNKLTLVTRNTKDYQPGGELEVLIPYVL
ncbi:MAG: type II toxin-antitoxin system VapC family toxin [Nitrococcus sp.]|nr:type II toxin-antitoxin system VapC family toxin [Nitrococcus sp.]